jgi:hypothetical protein
MSSDASKFRYVKSDIKVSSYDRLSAILIAAITIIGFMTTILFLIWLTTDVDYTAPTQGAEIIDIGDTGDEKPEGFEDDAFEPGVEEFPEIETPQLAQAIEAVTDAVSSVRANSEKVSGDAAEMGKGKGFGAREGGPGGGGGEGVPEFKRWKINYEAPDIDTYKRQLSFFNIDIGVVRRVDDDVFRISDPAGKSEVVRSSREKEKSLYFAHIKRRMMRWDEAIAQDAGVETENANLIQFYPNSVRARIRQQEAAFLNKDQRQLSDIRQTVIKLVAVADGFDFVVEDILYRN